MSSPSSSIPPIPLSYPLLLDNKTSAYASSPYIFPVYLIKHTFSRTHTDTPPHPHTHTHTPTPTHTHPPTHPHTHTPTHPHTHTHTHTHPHTHTHTQIHTTRTNTQSLPLLLGLQDLLDQLCIVVDHDRGIDAWKQRLAIELHNKQLQR